MRRHPSPDALAKGTTFITDDAPAMIASPGLDVVIDATGNPSAGIAHVLACCRHKKPIVMVNVEADALAGPLLARRAAEAGIVYSLAYGDQPALICEQVDWARACGFTVVAAGKGTKYLPVYHTSTPDTVWNHYGFTQEQVAQGDFNAKMFNSFLDGTKSAIEMAAVANATGLVPPEDGLRFPPCGADDLPRILKPRAAGGLLDEAGQVEVVSSLERDGRPVYRDLRWGVYVTFTTDNPYSARCFREYGVITDESGRYSALYRPAHLIGLELGISVASVTLRGEPTGAARGFAGDVAATAKRDLAPGGDPGWRRGLHRLRNPPAGPQVRRRRVPPHRPRPWGQARQTHRRRSKWSGGTMSAMTGRTRRSNSAGRWRRCSRRSGGYRA